MSAEALTPLGKRLARLQTERDEYLRVLTLIAESRNLGVNPEDVEIVRSFIDAVAPLHPLHPHRSGEWITLRRAVALDALDRMSGSTAFQVIELARKAVEDG